MKYIDCWSLGHCIYSVFGGSIFKRGLPSSQVTKAGWTRQGGTLQKSYVSHIACSLVQMRWMQSIQYVVATYRITWNLRLKLNLVLYSKAALAYILMSWQFKTLMPLIIITCDVIFPLILVITELQFVITGRICRRQLCRYFVYSRADFGVFRPAAASRCTDQGQIWQGGEEGTVGPLLPAKFDLDRFRGGDLLPPKLKKNRILPI